MMCKPFFLRAQDHAGVRSAAGVPPAQGELFHHKLYIIIMIIYNYNDYITCKPSFLRAQDDAGVRSAAEQNIKLYEKIIKKLRI